MAIFKVLDTENYSEEFYNTEAVYNYINHESDGKTIKSIHAQGSDISAEEIHLLNNFALTFPIFIENTIFKNELKIEFSMPKQIAFVNCRFKQLTIAGTENAKINIDVLFIKCTVNKCDISNCNSITNFIIKDKCNFTNINFASNNFIYNIDIRNSIIHKKIEFFGMNNNHTAISYIKLSNSNIRELLSIAKCSISELLIIETVIKKHVSTSSIYNRLIINLLNKNTLSNFYFINCIINSGLVHIYSITNTHFEFTKTRAYGKIEFKLHNCKNSSFQIKQCYFSEEVSFFDSTFVDDCIELTINETVFKELVIFDKNQPQKFKIFNSLFQKGVLIPINGIKNETIVIKNPEKIHSSVWCVLKNQSLSSNDKINALVYRKYEMNSYTSELSINNEVSEEKIVLWLNKLSNNHGLSWSTGVCFTVIVWLSFYFLYVLSEYNFSFYLTISSAFFSNAFWSDAISFLWLPQGLGNLTDKLREDRSFLSSISMVLTFVLGKIAIAYGIYQTISAFRKHGKI